MQDFKCQRRQVCVNTSRQRYALDDYPSSGAAASATGTAALETVSPADNDPANIAADCEPGTNLNLSV